MSATPAKNDSFFAKIGRQLKDLTYVEVITAAGDPKTPINPEAENVLELFKDGNLKVLARTVIELDGDIVMLLPTESNQDEVKINREVMDIHKENVAAAVQNWNNFMNTMLMAMDLIAKVTGLTQEDVFKNLKLELKAPS